MLLIDYAFFVKESTKITWEGRGYPVTKMIILSKTAFEEIHLLFFQLTIFYIYYKWVVVLYSSTLYLQNTGYEFYQLK